MGPFASCRTLYESVEQNVAVTRVFELIEMDTPQGGSCTCHPVRTAREPSLALGQPGADARDDFAMNGEWADAPPSPARPLAGGSSCDLHRLIVGCT